MEQPDATTGDVRLLVRRARDGQEEAFDELVRMYRDRVFRWALVQTGDVDDAEDAAQEALVRLHRGLPKFRGGSAFETWLYAITRNAAADVVRRASRRRRLADRYASLVSADRTDTSLEVLDRMDRRRLAAAARRFLDELPVRQREAVDLVDFQGLTPAEASRLSSSHPATLRTHLFRGRKALRSRLLDAVEERHEVT